MNNTTTSTADAYIPGVCNINRKEIAYRRNVGIVLAIASIAFLTVFVALDLAVWIRFVLIVPTVLAAACFLQAKNKFCVGYGAAGQHNANEGGAATDVGDTDAVAKDKKRASQINRQAFAIGLVITLLTLLIPS